MIEMLKKAVECQEDFIVHDLLGFAILRMIEDEIDEEQEGQVEGAAG